MPKILRAYGPAGSYNGLKDWNWCEGQPVNVHGLVCDSPGCGCNRSFLGVDSLTGATQAVVEEVTEADYLAIKERLFARVMKGWANNQQIAEEAADTLDRLSDELLRQFNPGQVVTVLKEGGSVELTPVGI